jgi:hypothetical protein
MEAESRRANQSEESGCKIFFPQYFSFVRGGILVKPETPPPLALEHGTSAH